MRKNRDDPYHNLYKRINTEIPELMRKTYNLCKVLCEASESFALCTKNVNERMNNVVDYMQCNTLHEILSKIITEIYVKSSINGATRNR